ncbi:hypothetical protein KQI82_14135 [Oscillibacter sp. MSJ-2]|uniref:Lactate dehydrogenase n=2 Tax=Dysosmobacter acutus TaxID=2841504 RepID=A0ABS6FDB7_9FIRM|nr:hypothetical protein [Dysosmobacter acutus]
MKMGVIGGAGLLGSTTAFCVGCKNLVDEIKLIDIRENMVTSHAMDLTQAFLPLGGTKVTPAHYEDLGDCEILLCAAAVPEGKIADRNESLRKNVNLLLPICEQLDKYCRKDAVVITSAAPIDVLTYVLWDSLKWDKRKFIGFCANDTLRFKWATELVTGKHFDKLDALCVGEHGDGQVRLYDQMEYDGRPLVLTESEHERIEEETANWFARWQALESGRTTGWTSAVMMTAYIEAIVKNSGKVFPCSTVLAEQFGYEHVSMGMPCKLGTGGIQAVLDPQLTPTQKSALAQTADKISGLITQAGF